VAALDLGVTGTEGFDRAEVTAGGVPLRELHRVTLESRKAPGLHFCGEVCHATGRLGGFNFQWAWSSGFAAGRGAAAGLGPSS
jgi:predicted flavoprotein YhiN